MFGQSTRRCACPSPARRGTSPVSTASRLILPSARNGTAKTPLPFYLLEPSHFSWQPLDPKCIGALTLRGSYTEAFHAPALSEISPASTGGPIGVRDPLLRSFYGSEGRVLGNPNLQPEMAYEWSYGAVYSPKWIKGLTLSADWWHIDMRDLVTTLGAQTILKDTPAPNGGSTEVGPGGSIVVRGVGTDPNEPGPVLFDIDPNLNLSAAI